MTEIVRTKIGILSYLTPTSLLSDEDGPSSLWDAVNSCLESHENNLVIDFTRVSTVSGIIIETLLDIQDKLTEVGGFLKIVNTNTLIKDIFKITRFSEFGTVPFGSEKELEEILLEKNLITESRIVETACIHKESGKRVSQIMVNKGWVSEDDMIIALSEQLSIPCVKLKSGLYDPAAISLIEQSSVRKLEILPIINVRGTLFVATTDPQTISGFDYIENHTGLKVQPILARRNDILKSINEIYTGVVDDDLEEIEENFEVLESGPDVHDDFTSIDEMAATSPIINLVNRLVLRAINDGASDIHIEPSRTKCRIRFRIDGILHEVRTLESEMHAAVASRLKVMACLDIAERRLPQDGRIQVSTQGRVVDLRFSSLPGIFGEKIVLRILDKNQSILDIDRLGMKEANLEIFKALLKRSHGLILVTGPTGSGKSTTLYAAINDLNSLEKNIVTIEDPVEYQIDIINQNQVKDYIGLTFAKILKHVLRQDPDIIMVGEIREKETADIAIQASLTGHLVLSTLHTNDSVGAITRLIDMGIESYLLSSALIGVLGQRLLRRVCPECKTSYLPGKELKERLGLTSSENTRLARGRGCKTCYDSGLKGRLGIHEILVMDSGLEELINADSSQDKMEMYLREQGYKTLEEDGYDRVIKGLTTIEEVLRVVNNE